MAERDFNWKEPTAVRPLSKSETQKLRLFLGLVFIVGNLLGIQWLLEERSRLVKGLGDLHTTESYNQTWITDQALWEKRAEWLARNQPKFDSTGQENVRLLEFLQKLAKDNGLTIVQPTLLDPRVTANYQEVGVQLRLVGPLESLCRLLTSLQQPNLFHAVTTLSLRSDSDPTKVSCDLRVAGWNQPRP